MVQILPRVPSTGNMLASGLSEGLQMLAQNKLQEMARRNEQHYQQQQRQQQFQKAGIEPGLANLLQALPEAESGKLLRSIVERPGGVGALRGGMPQGQVQQGGLQALQQMVPQQMVPGEPMQQGQKPLSWEQVLQQPKPLSSGEQQRHMDKRLSMLYPEIQKRQAAAESARTNLQNYDTLLELSKSGQLMQGRWKSLIDKSGLGDWFTNEPTQVAEKIISRLALAGPSMFTGAGRYTNFMAGLVEKMLPRLAQLPNAFEGVIYTARAEDQVKEALADAENEIIEEYTSTGRALPLNLTALVTKRAEPAIKNIYDEMRSNLEDALERGSGKKKGEMIGEEPSEMQAPSIGSPFTRELQKGLESLLPYAKKAGRLGAQTLSRAAEALGGLPGDAREMVNVITGGTLNDPVIGPFLSSLPPFNLLRGAPTSKQLREASESATGGITAPQNEAEERWGNIVQGFTNLALPTGGPVKNIATHLARALAVPTAGELAHWATKSLAGKGEGTASAVKMGTMLLASMFGNRAEMRRASSSLYDTADALLEPSSVGKSKGASKYMGEMFGLTSKAPGLNPEVGQYFKQAQGMFGADQIKMKDALFLEKDILRSMRINKRFTDTDRKFLGDLVGKLREAIHSFGEHNPVFKTVYDEAQELWKAQATTGALGDILTKTGADRLIKSDLLRGGMTGLGITSAVGTGFYGGLGALAKSSPALAAGWTINEGWRLAKIFAKSPKARQYYTDALKGVVNNEAPGIIAREIVKLDKVIAKAEREA